MKMKGMKLTAGLTGVYIPRGKGEGVPKREPSNVRREHGYLFFLPLVLYTPFPNPKKITIKEKVLRGKGRE